MTTNTANVTEKDEAAKLQEQILQQKAAMKAAEEKLAKMKQEQENARPRHEKAAENLSKLIRKASISTTKAHFDEAYKLLAQAKREADDAVTIDLPDLGDEGPRELYESKSNLIKSNLVIIQQAVARHEYSMVQELIERTMEDMDSIKSLEKDAQAAIKSMKKEA